MTGTETGNPPPWSPPPAATQGPPDTNGLAVASLVLSLLSLCGVGSVLGVIFGHISLGQIKRNGQRGRGFAIAGLVVGYLGIVAMIAALALITSAVHSADDHGFTDANGVHTSSDNRVHPPQADVGPPSCTVTPAGTIKVLFEVTNHSSETSDYGTTLSLAQGTRDLGTVNVGVVQLRANETTTAFGGNATKVDASPALTCRFVEVDRTSSTNVGSADANGVIGFALEGDHPPQADARVTACRTGAPGRYRADVEIVNHATVASRYTVTVGFDGSPGRRLAAGAADVARVDAGQTTTVAVTTNAAEPTDQTATCRLMSVTRTPYDFTTTTTNRSG